jgi:hypothetical protein
VARKAAKKRKYSRSSGKDVESEMRRYKKGTAKSGRGGKGLIAPCSLERAKALQRLGKSTQRNVADVDHRARASGGSRNKSSSGAFTAIDRGFERGPDDALFELRKTARANGRLQWPHRTSMRSMRRSDEIRPLGK